ncbi:MAG: DJ-1/PfpI family protein [Deltaproteobacteria bacterium]|nr:DJ-1/PfpI family protein [Deltaproteobacteria bacterium]
MQLKAYLLIFDGLADWEPALALCEINKSGKYTVVTVGFSDRPITTMGGCTIIPDTTIDAINPDDVVIFIMPGGNMWERGPHEEIIKLLCLFHARGTVIAAICGATLEIARTGLTHDLRHTSNSKGYLKAMIPDYRDDDLYVDKPAIADKNLITATGLGSVEFACEIVRLLNIYTGEEIQELYEMFKHSVIPARFAI